MAIDNTNQDKAQHIGCKVASCEYNDSQRECSLKSIQVMPCPGGSTGKASDESMCGSYRSKD